MTSRHKLLAVSKRNSLLRPSSAQNLRLLLPTLLPAISSSIYHSTAVALSPSTQLKFFHSNNPPPPPAASAANANAADSSDRQTSPPNNKEDSNQQERLANLGSMIDYIRLIVPEALNMTPDPIKLDENIKLRVSPTIQPNVPIITGQLKYITSLKATQLIFKTFVLNPHAKLHVLRIEVIEKGESSSYGILPNVTKLIVHWKTCGEDCPHLQQLESLEKEVNEVKVEKTDLFHKFINKYWKKLDSDGGVQDNKIDRILFGIFVFELNDTNEKILVHNVENLEILNENDCVDDDVVGGKFAAT